MKLNRLLCILSIIGSGIFVSYYGGNISYALFFLTILIPILSYIYTIYVYQRFKLHQTIDRFIIVKGDWIDYSFVVANEDYLTFRNLKLNLIKDKSTIENADTVREYSLLPGESERLDTRIKCNYRGEYHVGVDSVEIKDFLCLFSITYPVNGKLTAIVLPRVVPLERLGIAPPEIDVKNPIHFSDHAQEELDTELRKFYPGDHKKRIHWKVSAKRQELVSRKYHYRPKAEVILFMDLMKTKEDELSVIIVEDKIIESVLAIANFYTLRATPSTIICDMGGAKQINISSKAEFNAFYKACGTMKFEAKTPICDFIKERSLRGEEGIFNVAVTHLLTKEFYRACLQVLEGGNHMCVLFISDDVSENTDHLIDSLRLAGVDVYRIMSKDEIGDILSRGI